MRYSFLVIIAALATILISCNSEPPEEYFELSQKGLEYVLGKDRTLIGTPEELDDESEVLIADTWLDSLYTIKRDEFEKSQRIKEDIKRKQNRQNKAPSIPDSVLQRIKIERIKSAEETRKRVETKLKQLKELGENKQKASNSLKRGISSPLEEEKTREAGCYLLGETSWWFDFQEFQARNNLDSVECVINIHDDVSFEWLLKLIISLSECEVLNVKFITDIQSEGNSVNQWSYEYYIYPDHTSHFSIHTYFSKMEYHISRLELAIYSHHILRQVAFEDVISKRESYHKDDIDWRLYGSYNIRTFENTKGFKEMCKEARGDILQIRKRLLGCADTAGNYDWLKDTLDVDLTKCEDCNLVTLAFTDNTPWKIVRETLDVFSTEIDADTKLEDFWFIFIRRNWDTYYDFNSEGIDFNQIESNIERYPNGRVMRDINFILNCKNLAKFVSPKSALERFKSVNRKSKADSLKNPEKHK
ncbi:hypothetical protein K9N50_12905 [bacterium]|nr:hypothetical protein [bacterium]